MAHFAAKRKRTQLLRDAVAERGLGEEEEVVDSAAEHRQRGDQARLRGEQQRLAGLARPERLDVVRDHPLEIGRRIGTRDADVGAGSRNGLVTQ